MVRISECARLTGQSVILSLRNHVGIECPIFKYCSTVFLLVVLFLNLLIAQDFYSIELVGELLKIFNILSTRQSVNINND